MGTGPVRNSSSVKTTTTVKRPLQVRETFAEMRQLENSGREFRSRYVKECIFTLRVAIPKTFPPTQDVDAIDEHDRDSDLETLAEVQKKLKLDKQMKMRTKRRNGMWNRIDLAPRAQKLDTMKNNNQFMTEKIERENWSPIDLFKLFFND
ncbi:hypothetical protein QE152_g9191 [Popillia japonica]|uniref:Uncharacterized protein n=1 Tax=Popillia japonica TaxID=7064 RepID=A0AAW1LYK0_POPJA